MSICLDLNTVLRAATSGVGFPSNFSSAIAGGGNAGDGKQSDVANGKDADVDCTKAQGNPVMIASGNKVEFELDLIIPGRNSLVLTRTYNRNSSLVGVFGPGWFSQLDRRALFTGSRNSPSLITIYSSDGSPSQYPFDATTGRWLRKAESAMPPSQADYVEQVNASPLRYRHVSPDGVVAIYSGGGSLLSSHDAEGIGWNLNYGDAEYLTTLTATNPSLRSITHTNGRSLRFTWANFALRSVITQVIDPADRVTDYSYSGALLIGVTYPATPKLASGAGLSRDTISYHLIGDNFAGKSFNGVRYSTFTYDSQGRVTSSEHAGGVDRHTFSYESDGSTIVTNPLGRSTRHWFNTASQPLRIEAAGTATCPFAATSFERSNDGRTTITTLPSGLKMLSTLDSNGFVVEEALGFGLPQQQVTRYTWEGNPRRISRIESPSGLTTMTYDAKGRERTRTLVAASSSAGSLTTTTSYVDGVNGLPLQITVDGPLSGSGDSVAYHFNANGDLTDVTTAVGTTTFGSFTATGLPTQVTDPNGLVTTLSYDGRGRVIQQARAGRVWSYAYDLLGQVLQVSDTAGQLVSYEYDAARRNTAVVESQAYPATIRSHAAVPAVIADRHALEYDVAGNVVLSRQQQTMDQTQPSGPFGQPIKTTYSTTTTESLFDWDSESRLIGQRGRSGQITRTLRGADGMPYEQRVIASSDGSYHTTRFGYDALRQLDRVTDPLGGVLSYGRDAAGRVISITDPKGATTSYVRDELGLVTQIDSPDTGVTRFTYHPGALPATEVRADGTSLSHSYDASGRITQTLAQRQGQSLTRSYSYDSCSNGKGRLCGISESNGESLSWTYTSWGAVATQTSTIAGQSFTISYAYNSAGLPISLSYPSGFRVDYAWADARLRSITGVNTAAQPQILVDRALYLPSIAVASFVDASGGTRSRTRDLDGRLTVMGNAGAGSLNLSYDQRNFITGTGSTLGLNNLEYDELGRLRSASDASGTFSSWTFDANGNRSGASYNPGGSVSYSVGANNNRLNGVNSAGGSRSLVYDAAGNLSQDQRSGVTDCHGYDAFMRHAAFSRYPSLTACTSPAGGPSSSASYRFNGQNQRSFKNSAGESTRYVYGPSGELLYEVSSTGKVRHYVWFAGEVVAVNTNAGTHAETYAVYSDHLGRPYKVLDRNGVSRWAATVKLFDRTVTQDSLGGFHLGFPGQYLDTESGFWQNWHRTYDSTIGRYTQSDPIGLAGGINTYGYALANPISYVDPDGLLFMSTVGGLQQGTTLSKAATFGGPGNAAMTVGLTTMAVGATASSATTAGLRLVAASGARAGSTAAQCTFKTAHYAARLEAAGVSTAGAESAVASALGPMSRNMAVGADVVGRLTLNGVLLEYRARLLASGLVSVGTIFPVAGGGK